MPDEILHRRPKALVRRQRLAPGQASEWHTDACHRVTVVLSGSRLAIEFRDGSLQCGVTAGSAEVTHAAAQPPWCIIPDPLGQPATRRGSVVRLAGSLEILQ